jgi:hypothetical protein
MRPTAKLTASQDELEIVARKPAAGSRASNLLNLCFFEFDVFPDDWVVLLKHEFFGARARILLSHIEESGACCREQLNLLRDGLRHNLSPKLLF